MSEEIESRPKRWYGCWLQMWLCWFHTKFHSCAAFTQKSAKGQAMPAVLPSGGTPARVQDTFQESKQKIKVLSPGMFLSPCCNSQQGNTLVFPTTRSEDHEHPGLTFSLDPCAQRFLLILWLFWGFPPLQVILLLLLFCQSLSQPSISSCIWCSYAASNTDYETNHKHSVCNDHNKTRFY